MATRIVGKSLTRLDAADKVRGVAMYPGDFVRENMAWMKLKYVGKAHARILKVDIKRAMEAEGVIAVLTSKDLAHNEYGLQYPDQPVLCGPCDKEGADEVRFMGDAVAAVVAETEEQAEAALDLLDIELEELPAISDPREALKEGAQRLHPDYPGTPIHPELIFEDNIASRHRIRLGDVDAAFADPEAVIVEAEYEIPDQEHAYLQPEAGLAYLDDEGRICIVVGGQWAHEDQHQVAHSLGLPPEKVRIIYPAIGGAFGGREDESVQIVLALAVQKTGRPVKLVYTREESIRVTYRRHRVYARARWAAKPDGTLLAAENHVVADAGAYVYTTNKVLGNLLLTCNGPYSIPNVKSDVLGVYTNNTPKGAFRGFGAPQGNFIAENQMNKLAEKLGMDPVAMREINLVKPGEPMPWGKPLTDDGRGLGECLRKAAVAMGWTEENGQWTAPTPEARPDDPPYIKRGFGIAVGHKNVGFSFGYQDNCWVAMELEGAGDKPERARVYTASSEVGQGTRTVIRQMAAEVLGLEVEQVEVEPMDTAITESSGSCSASRMTFMVGNAINGAADAVKAQWDAGQRPARAEYKYLSPKTTKIDLETGDGDPNFSYGYVAMAAEVEIDTELGLVRFPRIVCANDVGRAINPRLLEGQVQGAVVQAIGWCTVENFIEKDCKPQTTTLSTYLIPTVEDIPDKVDVILVENPEPNGPFGARGMGEMPYVVVASAAHQAVRQATGLWFDVFPFNAERVLEKLKRT